MEKSVVSAKAKSLAATHFSPKEMQSQKNSTITRDKTPLVREWWPTFLKFVYSYLFKLLQEKYPTTFIKFITLQGKTVNKEEALLTHCIIIN